MHDMLLDREIETNEERKILETERGTKKERETIVMALARLYPGLKPAASMHDNLLLDETER